MSCLLFRIGFSSLGGLHFWRIYFGTWCIFFLGLVCLETFEQTGRDKLNGVQTNSGAVCLWWERNLTQQTKLYSNTWWEPCYIMCCVVCSVSWYVNTSDGSLVIKNSARTRVSCRNFYQILDLMDVWSTINSSHRKLCPSQIKMITQLSENMVFSMRRNQQFQ